MTFLRWDLANFFMKSGCRPPQCLPGPKTRRPAPFVVPDFIAEHALAQYLADLFHESATPSNGDVRPIP